MAASSPSAVVEPSRLGPIELRDCVVMLLGCHTRCVMRDAAGGGG